MDVDHLVRYLSIFGKNRYPRFLAESRNVLDDRLSTLICQPSTSVESTGSHISSLKLDTVAGDAWAACTVASFCNENEFIASIFDSILLSGVLSILFRKFQVIQKLFPKKKKK